jgi:hypothetical protein
MARYTVEMNGNLSLPLGEGGRYGYMHILGGPFDTGLFTDGTYNVNLKAEGTRKKFDTELPIEDYGVPLDKFLLVEVIEDVIVQAMAGKLIVTGCMGGMGRTGLFMAILAKACGIQNPVRFVRAKYYHHAVETEKQEEFVANLDVSWVPRVIEETYKRMHPGVEVRDNFLDPLLPEPAIQPPIAGFWQRLWNYIRY